MTEKERIAELEAKLAEAERAREAAERECQACHSDGVRDSKAEICGWHYELALKSLAEEEDDAPY